MSYFQGNAFQRWRGSGQGLSVSMPSYSIKRSQLKKMLSETVSASVSSQCHPIQSSDITAPDNKQFRSSKASPNTMSRSFEGEYETRLSMQKAHATIEVESKNALRNASPVPDPVIHALSEVPLAALQCAWNVLTSIFVEETQKCEKRFCITRGPKAPPFRGNHHERICYRQK